MEVWQSNDEPSFIENNQQDTDLTSFIRIFSVAMLTWQALFNISDLALKFLIKVVGILFRQLYSITQFHAIKTLCHLFPRSVHGVRNCVGLNRDEFTKYVICCKCHSIYIWKECFETQEA